MSRTRLRALPRGLLKPQQALAFSTITGILGTSILYFGKNLKFKIMFSFFLFFSYKLN